MYFLLCLGLIFQERTPTLLTLLGSKESLLGNAAASKADIRRSKKFLHTYHTEWHIQSTANSRRRHQIYGGADSKAEDTEDGKKCIEGITGRQRRAFLSKNYCLRVLSVKRAVLTFPVKS